MPKPGRDPPTFTSASLALASRPPAGHGKLPRPRFDSDALSLTRVGRATLVGSGVADSESAGCVTVTEPLA